MLPLYLSSAGISAGPPEKRANLMGEHAGGRGKKPLVVTYALGDLGFEDGKWLECGYGEYHQVSLSKRLDAGIKVCTVTYRQGEMAGQKNIDIKCR